MGNRQILAIIAISASVVVAFTVFAVVNITLGDMEKAKKQEELDRLTEARDQALRDLENFKQNEFFNRNTGLESISDMLPTKEELANMPSIADKLPTKEDLEIRESNKEK